MALGSGKTSAQSNSNSHVATPPITTRRSTRQTDPNNDISLRRNESSASNRFSVIDVISDEEYLNKSLITLEGEPFTPEHLSSMLFHIMQMEKVPLPVVEAIRVVAFLLENQAASKNAKLITSHITTQALKDIAAQVITAISLHIANMLITSESMTSRIKDLEKLQSDMKANAESTGPIASVERAEEAADAILSSLEDVKKRYHNTNPLTRLHARQNQHANHQNQ
ncbi:hypothetical protein PAXRUDRAFT_21301 [Paxillus rubicundulus Ve08.2h10]|uniref:Uncharacterized protein n=1 Tax=Paxillus rubicundulus Ve08.2h10 TaxID=930991 RepID=A0A0D0CQF7_9AGAM|nr:hypothetical protein PAXRUDRAFT_21301 [Paxillus rubicundulus Ve08.2h10]